MKKKVAFFLTMVLVLSLIATTAFAAKKSDNQTGAQVVTIIVFLGLIVGGFIAWVCHSPASVKEAQRRAKARGQEVNSALSEARTSRLGVVVIRFSWGYLKTYYIEGRRNEAWIHGASDSADGWGVEIKIINSCAKTIKYCTFHVRALDSVGNLAYVRTGYATQDLTGNGPIAHGDVGFWRFEHLMYSGAVSKMVLDSIKVEYMDGTTEEWSGNNIVWR